jgi:hypothetical protein
MLKLLNTKGVSKVKLNKTETKALYELVAMLISHDKAELKECIFTTAACDILQEYNPINCLKEALVKHKGSK